MADQDSLRRLWRYKSDLEQEPDEEKLLEILGRLKRLPVSIAALQETSIGKLVNSFRKHEGVVGDLARKVVSAWKDVVEKEVKSSRNRSPSQSPQHSGNSSCEEEKPEESGNESDADSWNSFSREEDSSQGSKDGRKITDPPLSKKRKHSTGSVGSKKEQSDRSSRFSKKLEHSGLKVENIKVEPADEYSSVQIKKCKVEKSGDYSGSGEMTTLGETNVTVKKEGEKHTSSSHSGHRSRDSGDHHSVSSGGHHSRSSGNHHSRSTSCHHYRSSDDHHSSSKTKSSSSNHSVNEKGDKQVENTKVDRKQKRHNISSSEEDDDNQAADSAQNNKFSTQLSLSSSSKKHALSSSHNHSASGLLKPSSSSSHSHSSSSSHKHSISNSHKHSSSSQKPSSSSHNHSSDSQKPSSSSHNHSSSTSQKTSSSSHNHSSSSSHKHSSSNSRSHSSSSRKHSSPSSTKHYSQSSNHGDPSPALLNHQSSSKQRSSQEVLASKCSPSQTHHVGSHREHSLTSSTSKRQSGSSSTQILSSDFHKDSDHSEDDENSYEVSRNRSTSSNQKSNSGQHPPDRKSAVSDKKLSASSTKEKEKYSSHSQKEKSYSSRNSGGHKNGSSSSKGSATSRHSEREKAEKSSSSSTYKENNSTSASYDRSGYKVSSSTVYIKSEKPSPQSEENRKSKSSVSSKQTADPKSLKTIKSKSEPSSHKKNKPKILNEDPEPDLFSDAVCIKTEPSSPVHKPKSSKQTPTDSSRTTPSASPTPSLSQFHLSSDIKIKSEPASSNDFKSSPSKTCHLKTELKQEKNLDSGSSEEDQKIISERDKKVKRKKLETSPQDENKMSFEDFMTFDQASLVKRGKSSQKSSSKNSSSSSSKNTQGNKVPGSKWSSSLIDSPSASKATFSVPTPSSNVTVTELDILSMLPETQATYKPLRYNPYYHDEEEREPSPQPLVDPDIIGTKSVSRTHVYSGRKHGVTEVKPLYDLCMQVLIDNIDAIDYVGGIPYSILKPVLERCSAQQLYQLEDYNPHFLEDSDELWKILCQRDFRGSKPAELETWRELYMRKFEERELKYQKLKQSMSTSIVKGQAGRKAQLAYVDTVAKPPREVLRKQKQFGTGCIVRTKNNPNIKTSSSGLKAYKPSTLVPAYNPMNDRPKIVRPMPPMMAKSLQMRKNMRR